MTSKIMYIENKSEGISGDAVIGRVTFSKSGRTLIYKDRKFRSLKGKGFKANYYDIATGEEFWISGCKKDGTDRLYAGSTKIDEDVKEEYWNTIRKK